MTGRVPVVAWLAPSSFEVVPKPKVARLAPTVDVFVHWGTVETRLLEPSSTG